MTFRYSTSKDHYSGYKCKETQDINVLFTDLAKRCISPVTEFGDKEMVSIESGDTWISKNHRSNGTIKERGNIALIDFEGASDKFKDLITRMESKNLFYIAVPSQSNKGKKESRYHIAYLLSEPFSVNAEAMKIQAKEFFDYIGYKWDEPDSGIDTRATLTASGYLSPTIPLKDAKSKGNKKIQDPYIDLDDVFKDTYKSKHNEPYKPSKPDNNDLNEEFTSSVVRGKRVKNIHTNIIRTTKKGYVLSSDSHIMVGATNKFVTFEKLVESLNEIEGENPRIGNLGCPICNPEHTELKPGYAYMQFDNDGKPYICCTGNGCVDKPYFTMAEGNIAIYRVDNADGSSKYIMLENDQIIYTHDRDKNFKLGSGAVADELYNRGQYIKDEHGNYSQGLTINAYVTGVESIQINHDPFSKEGLNIYNKTYNISPAARFEPKEEEPDEVIKEAIKSFDDDIKMLNYPISLIYLSYYLFHNKKIMAVLALVNPYRGSGKSFWALELPTWYLGYGKVSAMGSSAIIAGWDDEKLGSRIVVYEDIEELDKKTLGRLKSDIKSDATNGESKRLNVKGKGKTLSFGFNTAMTTNEYNQIPFDGGGDRRIYPCGYRMLDKAAWLADKLSSDSDEHIKHRTNAINFLYKIYNHCENNMTDELRKALNYKVPTSNIRHIIEDSTSTDGKAAFNIIKRGKSIRSIVKELSNIVVADIDNNDIFDLIKDGVEIKDDSIKIYAKTLKELWKVLPSGRDSMRSLNYRSLLNIFGIESRLKSVRINGKVEKGVEVQR